MFLAPSVWILCANKNFCLSGEIKPATVGARVECEMISTKKWKPKAVANHMNSQTYHSVTEWTSSKTTAAVWRPSFPSFSSLIHDLESQLAGFPKTISHSPFISFSSSDSSPTPMVAAENPIRILPVRLDLSRLKSKVKQRLLLTFHCKIVRLLIHLTTRGNNWKIMLLLMIAKTFFFLVRLISTAFAQI